MFTEEDKDKCVLYIGVYLIALSPLMWIVGPSLHKPPKFLRQSGGEGAKSRKAKESDGNLHGNNNSQLTAIWKRKRSIISTRILTSTTTKIFRKETWSYNDSRRRPVRNHQTVDSKVVVTKGLAKRSDGGSELNTNSDLENDSQR